MFRLRRRERIEGRALQETITNTKETRLANHHAQDVGVLQEIIKKQSKGNSWRQFWAYFDGPAQSHDKPGHRSITPKTPENTMFLMAQEPKHCKTRALEGSSMAVGGSGAALLALRESTHLAGNFKVLLWFELLVRKVGGCRPVKS